MEEKDVIQICLNDIVQDNIPLHDIVREFSGFDSNPKTSDLEKAIVVVNHLVKEYGVRVLFGRNLEELNVPIEEIKRMILDYWKSDRYDEINYGLWLAAPLTNKGSEEGKRQTPGS